MSSGEMTRDEMALMLGRAHCNVLSTQADMYSAAGTSGDEERKYPSEQANEKARAEFDIIEARARMLVQDQKLAYCWGTTVVVSIDNGPGRVYETNGGDVGLCKLEAMDSSFLEINMERRTVLTERGDRPVSVISYVQETYGALDVVYYTAKGHPLERCTVVRSGDDRVVLKLDSDKPDVVLDLFQNQYDDTVFPILKNSDGDVAYLFADKDAPGNGAMNVAAGKAFGPSSVALAPVQGGGASKRMRGNGSVKETAIVIKDDASNG